MLRIWIFLLFLVLSIVGLGYVGKCLEELIGYCNSARSLRNKFNRSNIESIKLDYFFITSKFMTLFSDPEIVKSKRQELERKHCKLSKSIGVFCLLGIAYFGYVIYLILISYGLFLKRSIPDFAMNVLILTYASSIFGGFYLSPILKLLKMKQAACMLEDWLGNLMKFSELISEKTVDALYFVFHSIVIGIYLNLSYIPYSKHIANSDGGININVVVAFLVVMFYNWVLLKMIAWLISCITKIGFIKKIVGISKNVSYMDKYSKLRQTTYLIFVTMLLLATIHNQDDSAFYKALGIAFLYDTYFDNKKKSENEVIEPGK